MKPEDYIGLMKPNWCPGCGNFSILAAARMAFSELKLDNSEIAAISGIGCASKFPSWIKVNSFDTLHGRPFPVAAGAKIANTNLKVFVFCGDGDCYGEGMNHFISTCRRNHDFVAIVHNNERYALTTGQTSPTTDIGTKTKTSLYGVTDPPVNPVALALSANASFVARGFAGDINHLKWLVTEAFKHRGFSLIDVLQPCVTFNTVNTLEWYKQRIYKLEESGHNSSDRMAAIGKSFEWSDKIPIGIFYRDNRASYESYLDQIKDVPLVKQDISKIKIDKLMEEFM